MPDPSRKFLYHEGDLTITYPDGTTVDPRADSSDDSDSVSDVPDESNPSEL